MTNLPGTPDEYGDDHPIIGEALQALSAWDDLDREQAARLLSMWQHNPELSDRERAAILARFPETLHAFTITEIEDQPDHWEWLCACGWVTIQYPPTDYQTPIHDRITGHVREATARDERTAQALIVDGCSCPREQVPAEHSHEIYARRLASAGGIVVNAVWFGGWFETLCWPMSEDGLSRAAVWCRRHRAVWKDTGARVEPGELAARGDAWLSLP